jgi:hypothetical protein
MTKKRKSILLIIGCLVLICSASIWALSSQAADDFFLLRDRSSESDLAIAFTIALRMNHPIAYDMIDIDLTPRVDEWMQSHQPPRCVRRINLLSGGVEGIAVYYSCNTADNRWYTLDIQDIIIEDMKVAEWGEVSEETN